MADSSTEQAVRRVAMVSVHGCPMMTPGMRFAGGMNVYLRDIATTLSYQGDSLKGKLRSFLKNWICQPGAEIAGYAHSSSV